MAPGVPEGSAHTQEDAAGRHAAVIAYLKRTAAQISARCLSEVNSLEEWERQRPARRRELREMLGIEPLPPRTPLEARATGALPRRDYRIEKLVFQSMPGLYVTGSLYLPGEASGPVPATLYACGHSPHPLGAKAHYQDRAIWFASHGYACLILDTLEFGEVAGIHHGTHDLNMWYWLSLGYTPLGVEVWNAIRALDYLETRPEVDASRIGMTGISGGGAVTWLTAAVDDRIAAAVAVCSTYTFGSQAAHWAAAGQCDCIYFHNTFLQDLPIAGALIAPRPLLLCSGQKDVDFPPDGYREVFRRVQRIYDFYAGGVAGSDRIREVDDDVGHEDAPLFRREARQWMNQWLRNDLTPLESEPEPPIARETAEELACLPRLPADAVNAHIHDRFIPAARPREWSSPAQWQERREELVARLREKVFGWFPAEPIPFETRIGRHTGGWGARYADYQEVTFNSEAGVRIRGQLFKPRQPSRETPLLLYAKRPGDSIHPYDLDELLPVLGRYTVLVLQPRLTEHPVSAAEHAQIERTAAWVGRTVAAMQVWDILRAVKWVTEEEKLAPASLAVYGKGDMGVLALYAGLFDHRIGRVILRDPPGSHWQAPALLNVLRITDIAEIAGAFAPRELLFMREISFAFEDTRKLYQLQGAPGQIRSAASLPDALQIWNYPP